MKQKVQKALITTVLTALSNIAIADFNTSVHAVTTHLTKPEFAHTNMSPAVVSSFTSISSISQRDLLENIEPVVGLELVKNMSSDDIQNEVIGVVLSFEANSDVGQVEIRSSVKRVINRIYVGAAGSAAEKNSKMVSDDGRKTFIARYFVDNFEASGQVLKNDNESSFKINLPDDGLKHKVSIKIITPVSSYPLNLNIKNHMGRSLRINAIKSIENPFVANLKNKEKKFKTTDMDLSGFEPGFISRDLMLTSYRKGYTKNFLQIKVPPLFKEDYQAKLITGEIDNLFNVAKASEGYDFKELSPVPLNVDTPSGSMEELQFGRNNGLELFALKERKRYHKNIPLMLSHGAVEFTSSISRIATASFDARYSSSGSHESKVLATKAFDFGLVADRPGTYTFQVQDTVQYDIFKYNIALSGDESRYRETIMPDYLMINKGDDLFDAIKPQTLFGSVFYSFSITEPSIIPFRYMINPLANYLKGPSLPMFYSENQKTISKIYLHNQTPMRVKNRFLKLKASFPAQKGFDFLDASQTVIFKQNKKSEKYMSLKIMGQDIENYRDFMPASYKAGYTVHQGRLPFYVYEK